MALSNAQITSLKAADQRFVASVAVFPAVTLTTTAPTPGAGSPIALKPMPMVSPRYSVVAHSATVVLYARDSYNRGVSYVGDGNVAWVNTGGVGTLLDNGDGTADYTAPASGTGPNSITMTATNSNGTSDAIVQVQYPKTTYDEIVSEITSISASATSHGWAMTMRIRGDATDFTVGKGVLLDVVDTWNGTESTFGGYKYPEGNFYGYIVDTEYFEDWSGDRWTGVKLVSSWYLLERYEIGETYWGKTSATGRFYVADFRPVDALHKILTEIVDYSKYHNVTLFSDTNIIDDLIIGKGTDSETNLASIIDDIMARGLALAYTDRYGSLLCVPDPDVRASEWWGTPSPVYTGAEILNESLVMNYSIKTQEVPATKKLTLDAYNSNRLGIYAISQGSAGTRGSNSNIRGLLCDDTLKLVSWAGDKRAQMNRDWKVGVNLPLNHTVDLLNFVDVDFTNPTQVGGLTASGRGWISEIAYRPTPDGQWMGSWQILRHMEGVTAAGDVSSWGGSGEAAGTLSPSGVALTPDDGSWSADTGGLDGWAFFFDFEDNNGSGYVAAGTGFDGVTANPAAGYAAAGWSGVQGAHIPSTNTSMIQHLLYTFDSRTITGMKVWTSANVSGRWTVNPVAGGVYGSQILIAGNISGEVLETYAGEITADQMDFRLFATDEDALSYSKSAVIAGRGVSPFAGDPTGNYPL